MATSSLSGGSTSATSATDSGTETLFSDGGGSSCSTPNEDNDTPPDTAPPAVPVSVPADHPQGPPNIQPYSGVLEKGKTVIRPIAFKPAMTPSSRFGVAGERYGSTPILTRPGSRLTLYGSSSDLHQHAKESRKNYSLDRKMRNSPLAMSSLTSLSHKLINYDSLESVRKSPMSNADSTINPYGGTKASSYLLSSCSGGGGSLVDLTPSPSDSGVSELEAALRDRDSELAYLRQTMEHNEQVIFRVYQEKEKVWERELNRLKTMQESRLRASAQKVLKLEQMLMMQTYQLQQEKRRLCADVQRSNLQSERLKQEVSALRNRLEETEWGLCQKTGEISLLKTQLKECQNDQTTKCQELLQLRTDHRELRDQLAERDEEIEKLQSLNCSKDEEIARLKEEVQRLSVITPPAQHNSLEPGEQKCDETRRLEAEIKELREELSEMSLHDYSDIEPGRNQRSKIIEEESLEDLEIQRLSRGLSQENIYYSNEIDKLRKELDAKTKQFESEKRIWAAEKEKVLRYQKQLQMNYVQMFRRTRALEAEIETLNMELEMDKNGLKQEMDLSHTIEL